MGERIAARFLEEKGYVILANNYRFEKAEIDIIAWIPPCIGVVFVEVKTLTSIHAHYPEEKVTIGKQLLLKKAAEAWLYASNLSDWGARFDIIAISLNKTPSIYHIEDAFD